jgi:uncharacterized membrane protein YfcA
MPKGRAGTSALSIILPPRDRGGMIVAPSTLVFIIVTFLIAGAVKGAIGLGLPTMSVALLGLVMPPAQAAALLVVPSMVTNVWQLAAGPRFGPLVRRLGSMLIGICLGSWAGVGLLAAGRSGSGSGFGFGSGSAFGFGSGTTALGLALALYALVGLSGMRLSVPARVEPWLSPWIGVLTGLVSGATGVFVIPAVPYLQALDLEKDDLVQALGLSFTVSTMALAIGLARTGAFAMMTAPAGAGAAPLVPSPLAASALAASALPGSPLVWSPLALSLLALLPALIGMAAGQWIRTRARPETFRRGFFMSLLLLGGHLCLR